MSKMSARSLLQRFHGRAVTGDTATGAVAEENLVEAGEDSAQRLPSSGKPVSGDCERCLEHGAFTTRRSSRQAPPHPAGA
jgi:hypothetical protein